MGKISFGWCVSLCTSPSFHLSRISCQPLVGRPQCSWHDGLNPLWASISAQPCCTSFSIDFSIVSVLSVYLAYLLLPWRSMASKSDFLVPSSIGNIWYLDPFWIMSKIGYLYSWCMNIVARPDRFRNSEPYSSGLPFWACTALLKFLLELAGMLMLCCAAVCVRLKEKTVFMSSLFGILRSFVIVVTRHDICDWCF